MLHRTKYFDKPWGKKKEIARFLPEYCLNLPELDTSAIFFFFFWGGGGGGDTVPRTSYIPLSSYIIWLIYRLQIFIKLHIFKPCSLGPS